MFRTSWSMGIHTCHMGRHVDFHPLHMLRVVVQNYRCKLKLRAHEILNQWEFMGSREPWPDDFCVNMPKLTY